MSTISHIAYITLALVLNEQELVSARLAAAHHLREKDVEELEVAGSAEIWTTGPRDRLRVSIREIDPGPASPAVERLIRHQRHLPVGEALNFGGDSILEPWVTACRVEKQAADGGLIELADLGLELEREGLRRGERGRRARGRVLIGAVTVHGRAKASWWVGVGRWVRKVAAWSEYRGLGCQLGRIGAYGAVDQW